MIPLPVLLLAPFFAAAPPGALRVEADYDGIACIARLGGKAMAPEEIAARPRRRHWSAIVVTHLDTPYKCLGATLFNLKRRGFRTRVDDAVIVDAPEPLLSGETAGIDVAERVYRACGIEALSVEPLGEGRAKLVLGGDRVRGEALECGARWIANNAGALGIGDQ